MPNRILKESICESRDLSMCSIFAQDLYKRLITYADDYGRFNADPEIMMARLYPREMAVITVDDVIDGLIELAGVGKVGFYTSAPRHEVYGAFPRWGEHQRVRDSKKKNPDPTDTAVNDWYYRRFIPVDMKIAIINRDRFCCQICGEKISEVDDAKKLVKMGTGLFHFDHIVPCNQGGRATMENLRLACAKCNLSRKKSFSFDEILQFAATLCNSPQLSSDSGNVRPNPIQSESESESNPNPNPNCADADAFKIQHDHDQILQAAENAGFPGNDMVRAKLIDAYAQHGKEKVLSAIEECATHSASSIAYLSAVLKGGRKPTGKPVNAQQYDQRDYSDEEDLDSVLDSLRRR